MTVVSLEQRKNYKKGFLQNQWVITLRQILSVLAVEPKFDPSLEQNEIQLINIANSHVNVS